jgi:hypothetical protein
MTAQGSSAMFRFLDVRLARALGCSLLLISCVTVHSQRAAPAEAEVAAARAVAMWEIVSEGRRQGFVVRYDEDGETPRSLFSVRNPWHQELGLIDELGRFWRLVPHQDQATWLGSGTVEQGARRILDLGDDACLREVALEGAATSPAVARALDGE